MFVTCRRTRASPMSNTLRRPRRRPRARSVSFRTLWWVLVREACLHLAVADAFPDVSVYEWRRYLARCRTDRVRRIAARLLASLAWLRLG